MPSSPTPEDRHVDTLLTMISIAMMNEPGSYIAPAMFPVIPVKLRSDLIAEYPKEYWFRDEAQKRAPATESVGITWKVKKDAKYYCDNFAIHSDVADEDRANYDEPFDPDEEATILTTEKIRLRIEKAWAADFFKTGVWGTDVVGATDFTKWSDYGASNPITDVDAGRDKIHENTGKNAGRLAVGRKVWTKMKNHPAFIERIKYTQKAVLSRDLVASLLDLEGLFVGEALETTSVEEAATTVLAYIFGTRALLTYVPPRPALRTPSAGYTFIWTKMGGLTYVRRLRLDKIMADRIEAHTFFDQKAIATECGYMFDAVV